MPEYLNAGAETLAASAWNDGAGGSGSGLANGGDFIVSENFGLADEGLDQSALTGIESFLIRESVNAGQIGSNGESFNIDVDASADAVFSNRGNATVYLGGSGRTVNNLDIGGASRTWLTDGTAAMVTQDAGLLNVMGAATVTTMDQYGGSSFIKYGADITTLNMTGGTCTLERRAVTINAGGSGNLILDLDDSAGSVTLNTYGSINVIVRYANIAGGNALGGTLDFRQARKPMTPTLVVGGARIVPSASLTETSITRRGNSQKSYQVPLG